MSNLRILFYQAGRNLRRIFSGYNLVWHLLAIGLTYILVSSDFDWRYFEATRGSLIRILIIPAISLGGLLPILVPLILFTVGYIRREANLLNLAGVLGQAAFFGTLISGTYKAFTGRAHPTGFLSNAPAVDITHIFRFGFLRGGVFWGWPSTHTTLAFSMAVALLYQYPKNKVVKFWCLVYAFYVGLGVSVSIHWFSDFVAGAIIGTVIGTVVGKSFLARSSAVS